MFTLKTLVISVGFVIAAVVVLFLTLRLMGIDPRNVLPDDINEPDTPEHQVENEPACKVLSNRQVSEEKPAE
jgi:hypothetical protein